MDLWIQTARSHWVPRSVTVLDTKWRNWVKFVFRSPNPTFVNRFLFTGISGKFIVLTLGYPKKGKWLEIAEFRYRYTFARTEENRSVGVSARSVGLRSFGSSPKFSIRLCSFLWLTSATDFQIVFSRPLYSFEMEKMFQLQMSLMSGHFSRFQICFRWYVFLKKKLQHPK